MRKLGLLAIGAVMLMVPAGPAFAEGDVEKGKVAFGKCGICHQVGPNAQTLVGPPLTGIVGGKAASYEGYNYSPGMKKLGEEGYVWTPEHLDQFLADPKALLPNSPMSLAFKGISNAAERTDIIAYLKTFPE